MFKQLKNKKGNVGKIPSAIISLMIVMFIIGALVTQFTAALANISSATVFGGLRTLFNSGGLVPTLVILGIFVGAAAAVGFKFNIFGRNR